MPGRLHVRLPGKILTGGAVQGSNDDPRDTTVGFPGHREFLAKSLAGLFALLKYVEAPADGVLRASIFSEHIPGQIDRLLDEMKRLG